jgi:hypothetical protein
VKKTKMKKVLLLILWVLPFYFSAQSHITPIEENCGTVVPSNYAAWRNTVVNQRNMVTTLKHDTCLNKKFSVVFYIVQDSNYTWGGNPPLTAANLTTCINNLNTAYKPICVSFERCSTVVIPNFPFNGWRRDITEPIVTANWYTDKTINIYLVDTIKLPAGASGYAYMPGGKDVIVLLKNAVTGTTPIHEMGHFFGLIHTFNDITNLAPLPTPTAVASPTNAPALTSELVTRDASIRNCYTNGDGFCDTDADCFPQGFNVVWPCTMQHGPVDASQDYFIPPVDNYMTYFRNCRCKFTQEQYNFMARVIATQRLYLH